MTDASYEQLAHAVQVGIAAMRRHVPESVAVGILGAYDQGRAEPIFRGTRLVGLRTAVTAVALVIELEDGPVVACDVAIRKHADTPSGEHVVSVRYRDGEPIPCLVDGAAVMQFDIPDLEVARTVFGIQFASPPDDDPE